MIKLKSVAVIMSVYKNDKIENLIEAITSIQTQTYQYIDLYIGVDGPVPEDTIVYLTGINDNKNTKVLFYKNNRGLATVLNELIEYALHEKNYEYIARMDSDDISVKNRIQKQVDFMNNNIFIDISSSGCREFNDKGQTICIKRLPLIDTELKKNIIQRSPFVHPAVIFRSKVFNEGMRYPTDTHLSEDILLWILLAKNKYVFGNLDEVLLDFRVNNDFYIRRKSIGKAWSEFQARIIAMKDLRQFTIKNFIYSVGYFFLRISPVTISKIAYKYLR